MSLPSSVSGLILPLKPHLIKYKLLTPECFQELLVKFNLSNTLCLKAFISKLLGFAIVFGSALVKLPQLLKIGKNGSAEGISFFGTFLELMAVTANLAYSFNQGYPFSAYGEAVFLSAQTSLVALLILWFNGRTIFSLLYTILYGVLIYAIFTEGMIPQEVLWYGQAANIPMVVIGKLIQVFANFRNGHTGQLSAITIFMLAGGSMARIFTSIQETGDKVVIMTFVASTAVNLLLALQVLYYWKATNKVLAKKSSGQTSDKAKTQQKRKTKPKKE